jgi:hypothetical protein
VVESPVGFRSIYIVGLVNTGISAVTKLAVLAVLAVLFFSAMAGVVYMSLQGAEVKVPEITGKNFADSEKELASLGLKIKRRAERASSDEPNTVLEQLPKPGETVKTGQLIFVVTSKPGQGTEEAPSSLKRSIEEDDSGTIEEMISDKPKKTKTSTNSNSAKKKADTTRDVLANTATSTNTDVSTGLDPSKKDSGAGKDGDKGKDTAPANPPPAGRPTPPKAVERPKPSTKP